MNTLYRAGRAAIGMAIAAILLISIGTVGADEKSPHPKSIEALRNRTYSAGTITLLDIIPTQAGLAAQEFRYESDGFTIYGIIDKPAGKAPPGGWPVIVLAHGYIPPEHYSTTRNYHLVSRYYAAGGFLVVKPDYRGHGRSTGRSNGPTRTIDYSVDVLNLIAGLKGIPGADTDNVFLYGHSMGGEIGLRAMVVSRVLKGCTLWAPVTRDFPENTLYFIRKRNPSEAAQLQTRIDAEVSPEDYPALTPNSYLKSIDTPFVIHHGVADESVPFSWSQGFQRRLDAAGVSYTFHAYPGENHNISRSFYKVMDIDMKFFRSLM